MNPPISWQLQRASSWGAAACPRFLARGNRAGHGLDDALGGFRRWDDVMRPSDAPGLQGRVYTSRARGRRPNGVSPPEPSSRGVLTATIAMRRVARYFPCWGDPPPQGRASDLLRERQARAKRMKARVGSALRREARTCWNAGDRRRQRRLLQKELGGGESRFSWTHTPPTALAWLVRNARVGSRSADPLRGTTMWARTW